MNTVNICNHCRTIITVAAEYQILKKCSEDSFKLFTFFSLSEIVMIDFLQQIYDSFSSCFFFLKFIEALQLGSMLSHRLTILYYFTNSINFYHLTFFASPFWRCIIIRYEIILRLNSPFSRSNSFIIH